MTVYVDPAVRRREQQALASKKYRERHPDRVKASNRKHNASEKGKARRKRWYDNAKSTPEFKAKARALSRRSYSARTERDAALAACGVERPLNCQVCGGTGKIQFDHCHTKKVFRGWLCMSCNVILGHAKDDPERLRALANYLEK